MFTSTWITYSLFLIASISALPTPQATTDPAWSNSLAAISLSLQKPNTTQHTNATWFLHSQTAGACHLISKDTDLVVGLPLEFYSNTSALSAYCGSYIVITNPLNNKTVTSRISDGSNSSLLSLSVASWRAIDGDSTHLKNVTWKFANSTETAYAEAQVLLAVVEAVILKASLTAAASAAASIAAATSTFTPVETTPTPTPVPVVESFSGSATYYYQDGAAGSCGTSNDDSSLIVALPANLIGGNCGRSILITAASGASVTAVVSDTCAGCNGNSIDLSQGAFNAIGSASDGLLSVNWQWA